jgi:ribosome-binding protein aMBF1 (putative translation factor)
MASKQKSAHKKPRGRPAGSRYAGNIPCRLAPQVLAAVDEFAHQHAATRSEAIRRLIEDALGLRAEKLVKHYQSASSGDNIKYIISEPSDLITIRQVKAARALVGWSQSNLADHSGVSEPTIARLESADGRLGGRTGTIRKIRAALEAASVEFTNGDQPGVRLTAGRAASHARDRTAKVAEKKP